MNAELKLLKLLQIAVENGWEDKEDLTNGVSDGYYTLIPNTVFLFDDNHDVGVIISLNDLVINFEYEQTCFLKAIVNASEKSNKGLLEKQEDLVRFEDLELWENVEKSWTTKRVYCKLKQDYKLEGRPTSERLQWLFDTFSHLLP